MKIRYTEHKEHDISLTNKQIVEVTAHKLRCMLLPGDYIDKKGNLIQIVDNYHGSPSEYAIRKANILDLAITEVLEALRNEKL